MSRRRIGLAGIILLMIAIGIWVVLPTHGRSSGFTAGGSDAKIPENAVQVPGASTPKAFAPKKPKQLSSLWARPPAETASRNRRKSGWTWVLRELGASEQLLDRLVGGDLVGADRANQGDGASLWVLSQSGLKMEDMQQRLREASAAGFALAQLSLAALIDHGGVGAAGASPSKLSSLDLLNRSSSAVPASKAELANCEYFGECEGIPVDVDAAIAHAREAAQEGYFSAIFEIGPHLPAGQMDPNEVMAWGLIDASVQQQGCGGNVFTVRTMQNIMSTLNANNITAAARKQAEQFWNEYGSQIKANLGCGT